MNRTIQNAALTLLQHCEQAQSGIITQADMLGLPEFVQRYLRYAGVMGKVPICTVHLRQQGVMRLQPGQKWLSLVAEQYATANTLQLYAYRGGIR